VGRSTFRAEAAGRQPADHPDGWDRSCGWPQRRWVVGLIDSAHRSADDGQVSRRFVIGWGLVATGSVAWLAVPIGLVAGRLGLVRLFGAVPLLVLFGTGVYAWWRRPEHPAAWRLLLAGSVLSVAVGLSLLLDLATPGVGRAKAWVIAGAVTTAANLGLAALIDLFCGFPDGRYPGAWTRIVGVGSYILAAGSAVLTMLHPNLPVPFSTLDPPLSVPTPLHGGVVDVVASWPILDPFLFVLLPAALVAMGVRYRRADAEIRAQLRWPLAGVAVVAFVALGSWVAVIGVVVPMSGPAAQILWTLTVSTIPVGLLIGIVRHQLFDLRVAVRRSLSYAVLWLLIAAVYAGVAAVPGLAAADRVPPTVAVLVTIAATMLFQPARRRLERLADRLVFGERISGYTLIRDFGGTLQAAVPPAELAPRLAEAARRGLHAHWASVWILGSDATYADLVGASGDVTSETALVSELEAAGAPVGWLLCGPRLRGAYTAEDLEALQTLGRQAALGLVNARLGEQLQSRLSQLDAQAAELTSSRARLVAAEDAARRQLERDIHDGVQQQLVSLMTKLGLVRAQLRAGNDTPEITLESMQEEFRQVVADLRNLSAGIHPAILTDRGLVDAVVALTARIPLPVAIRCPTGPIGRFDPQVETAAYFAVAEALTNVMKHARASNAWVTMTRDCHGVTVDIRDDGCGFDLSTTRPRGLRGLRDRVEALDGSLAVTSSPTGPTSVRILLPQGSDLS
jgi:signal transduction histidine kinase